MQGLIGIRLNPFRLVGLHTERRRGFFNLTKNYE
jgi:hypothetical protein